jgi:DUF971 family protein
MERLELENYALIGDQLALSWADGSESYIQLERLRRNCPCAVCQGEPDALGRVVKPVRKLGDGAFQLVGIDPVGGYALQLRWADGHNSGIYGFDYLKRLGE